MPINGVEISIENARVSILLNDYATFIGTVALNVPKSQASADLLCDDTGMPQFIRCTIRGRDLGITNTEPATAAEDNSLLAKSVNGSTTFATLLELYNLIDDALNQP